MSGRKCSEGKPAVELIPPMVLLLEGEVFSYGAEKYSPDNWREGVAYRKYIGAAMRHILAFARGQDHCPESTLHHLSHARACLAILQGSQLENRGTDDRVKDPWRTVSIADPNLRA
jgi:hypothetical protein